MQGDVKFHIFDEIIRLEYLTFINQLLAYSFDIFIKVFYNLPTTGSIKASESNWISKWNLIWNI